MTMEYCMNKPICAVSDTELFTNIMEEKFPNRLGDYLIKIINKSNLKIDLYYYDEYEICLQNPNTKVIITLGKTPTQTLLNLPKSFKLKDYLEKELPRINSNKIIIPWYSVNHLLISGKKLEQKTIKLFSEIKAKYGNQELVY